MVVRRGMSVVLAGLAIGLAGSLAASRLIQHLLYGIPSSDMTTFVGAGLVFVVVALAACWFPAWKAMQIDPATSLRAE
jgi:putative ABC transport system permease protein